MNLVQLDEQSSADKLVRSCAAEGHVEAMRFPRALKGVPDEEVLVTLVPLGNPIISIDQGFVADHMNFIPDRHAGFLILDVDNSSTYRINTHTAQKILAELKRDMPNWHTLNVSNSVLHIKESTIEVFHCEDHFLERDELIDRNILGWQRALMNRLELNAQL
jgi:hypothetical protein